jgi:hypothetical protein
MKFKCHIGRLIKNILFLRTPEGPKALKEENILLKKLNQIEYLR